MGLRGKYDLVVCADVLHYVRSTPRCAPGSRRWRRTSGGVAFIEAFTSADTIDGDHAELQDRTPAVYRLFDEAGFVPIGLHLYVTRQDGKRSSALERGVSGPGRAPRASGPRARPSPR